MSRLWETYNFWRGNRLLEYLDQTYGKGKGAEAWANVLSAIRHTLVAAIARGGYDHYLNVAKAWRVWGFDLTMSPDLSVWVIEMNSRPDDVNAGPNGIYKEISIVVGNDFKIKNICDGKVEEENVWNLLSVHFRH